jgi:hypothetical protein
MTPAKGLGDEVPTFADRGLVEAVDEMRTTGLWVNPLALAMGGYGAEGAFVLAPAVAVAIEGAVQPTRFGVAAVAGAGALIFPAGRAFRGLTLTPRVVVARSLREGLGVSHGNMMGVGVAAGWSWAWEYGLSVRLGAGGLASVGGGRDPWAVHRAEVGQVHADVVVDASLGWLF